MTINGGKFEGNEAALRDGALGIYAGTAHITDVKFIRNKAKSGAGGAIRMQASSVTMTRCTFEENEVTMGSDGQDGGGAIAISSSAGTLVIRESTFIKNKAVQNRGHQILTQSNSLTIVNTQFIHCDGCTSNNYYNSAGGTGKTCSSSPCSIAPFTGTCDNRSPSELGVTCACSGGTVPPPGISDETSACGCPPGQVSATGKPPCQTCPHGYVTNTLAGGGATTCTACPVGTFSAQSHTACANCSAGSYTNKLNTPGATLCTPCEEGQYSTQSQTPCAACGAGRTTSGTASGAETDCLVCPQGRVNPM